MRANLILTTLFLVFGILCGFKYLGSQIYVDITGEPTLFDGFTPKKVGVIIIERPLTAAELALRKTGDESPKFQRIGFVKNEDKWVLGAFAGNPGGEEVIPRSGDNVIEAGRGVA